MRYLKVTFHMKSGKTIVVKFDKFEISKLNGSHRKMTYANENVTFAIELDAIEFVSIEKTLYGQLVHKY